MTTECISIVLMTRMSWVLFEPLLVIYFVA